MRRRRWRIREGSIADYGRMVLVAAGFWAVIFAAMVTTYPV